MRPAAAFELRLDHTVLCTHCLYHFTVAYVHADVPVVPDRKSGSVGYGVYRAGDRGAGVETEAADLFVPATFGPESQGSGYGNEQPVVWREKMVQAPGSCAPSWQFYRDVGRKLDPGRYPDFKDPEDLYRRFSALVPS